MPFISVQTLGKELFHTAAFHQIKNIIQRLVEEETSNLSSEVLINSLASNFDNTEIFNYILNIKD
ncbi:hypothetical protein [Rickettsia helvetica]|uniref:ANK-REP-REGION domain-containing protein n=1 Tax=Rickettsia helvetica TaxID=35789 RepID=A0ABP0T670_RICHE|nr:hypothetical protein [Rickettsia helvetica]MCZ6884636.1 hypothetical protein [Rickettsia endosymbiont of Ixodes ricinus]MCZ6896484.1 hypothetical protein [Rickettsia endosymbiont of Ixodes ricinus]